MKDGGTQIVVVVRAGGVDLLFTLCGGAFSACLVGAS